MPTVVISGSGLWKPAEFVTNEELVESYNAYATAYNEANKARIEAGELVVTEGAMSLREGGQVRLHGESPTTASSPGQTGSRSISSGAGGAGAPAGAGS